MGGSQPQKNPYYASTKAERCLLVKTLKQASRDHDQNSVRGEQANLYVVELQLRNQLAPIRHDNS